MVYFGTATGSASQGAKIGSSMNIRVTDGESDFCKQVAASLFLRGQLEKPSISALVREALRVYLDSILLERDVFVATAGDGGVVVSNWPRSHDVPVVGG